MYQIIKDEKLNIWNALCDLRDSIDDPKRKAMDRSVGICEYVHLEDYETMYFWRISSRAAFKKWQYFSGNIHYPVPHPEMSAPDAFGACEDKWDELTTYGWYRRDLLDYLIDYYAP